MRFFVMLVAVLHFAVVSLFSFFWSSFCCCIFICLCYFVHIFIFDVIPNPSVDYRWVFTSILYFQPRSSQSDSRNFHLFNLSVLAASATALRGHFLPTGVFYLTLLYRHFNLRLSRFPWELAVLPWSLQSFILILEIQIRPICLLDDSQ